MRLSELRPQTVKLLIQHGADGFGNDVFHDMVGGVVGTGRLTLAFIVFQIQSAFGDDSFVLLGLGFLPLVQFCIGDVYFAAFLDDGAKFTIGDLELELEQPLVNRAQLTDAERFVVDEHQAVTFCVYIAGQKINGERQVTVGYLGCLQELGAYRFGAGIVRCRVGNEKAPIVYRHIHG